MIRTYQYKKDLVWPTYSTCVRARTPRPPRRHSTVPRAATVCARACLSRGGTRGTAIWLGSYCTCLILSTSSAFAIVWRTRTPRAPRIHLNNELKIIARYIMKNILSDTYVRGKFSRLGLSQLKFTFGIFLFKLMTMSIYEFENFIEKASKWQNS